MKFYVAFFAVVAVATSHPLLSSVSSVAAELKAIVAAIKDPATEPATAHLLEHILEHINAIRPPFPINVGPAIVEQEQSPVSVGPEMIDFPLPEGENAAEVAAPVRPSPVVVGPIAPGSPAPLVQIIVNVNSADNVAAPVRPVVVPEVVSPVNIVDEAENVDPIEIIDVTPVIVSPVHVVDVAPVPAEPVIIGTPVLPSPAVVLPEELN